MGEHGRKHKRKSYSGLLQHLSPLQKWWLQELYRRGCSCMELSQIFDAHTATVQQYLAPEIAARKRRLAEKKALNGESVR